MEESHQHVFEPMHYRDSEAGDLGDYSQKQSTHHGFQREWPASSQSSVHLQPLKQITSTEDDGETTTKSDATSSPNLIPDANETNDEKLGQNTDISDIFSSPKTEAKITDGDYDSDSQMSTEELGSGSREKDVSKWCFVCREADKRIVKGEGCRPFGKLCDLQLRAGCPSCDAMFGLARRFREAGPDNYVFFDRYGSGLGWSYRFDIRPMTTRNRGSLFGPITMSPSNRKIENDPMGVVLDPSWVDIARIRRWLKFCDVNHGDECHGLPNRQDFVSIRPLYLLDVDDACLVEPYSDERYFALSYVWGPSQAIGVTTRANIESLECKGSMADGNAKFRLPQTVRDAMHLTSMLGQRFLWVDRLCIIQDDLENWHTQIKRMGSIYANAYCTLVAAGGSNAEYGIAGVVKDSRPRQLLRRASINLPSFELIEVDNDPRATMFSAWGRRGWTFQEQLLSRRALYLHDDVRWKCQHCAWNEDRTGEPEKGGSIDMKWTYWPKILRIEPWPDFVQWGELVGQYCQREFRFEGDAGAAFAGIEEILSHTFPGGFVFGMPEFYFDIALLWQPLYPLQRRTSGSHPPHLPSWSFLGWIGTPVQDLHDRRGSVRGPYAVYHALEWIAQLDLSYDYGLCKTSEISPKVDWVQKGPCRQERRIRNDYHIWKREQEQQPPAVHARFGWQKDGNDWSHPSIPHAKFRYAVPLGFHTVTDVYGNWSPFLRLRSQSAFFKISDIIKKTNNYECFKVELISQTGEWAGLLCLNTNEAEDVPFGQRCELVSISHGSVSNHDEVAGFSLPEWYLKGRSRRSERYEFYNVMWIRREQTWVIREAIGRVEKAVWDSQDLQEIDVELR